MAMLFYIFKTSSLSHEVAMQKESFVALSSLPDLALGVHPPFRHRSLSSLFEIYSFDGVMREYAKESFVIWHKGESR
jgi:hypothetical protein